MGSVESKRIGVLKYETYSDIFETEMIKKKIKNIRDTSVYPPYLTKNDLIETEKNDLRKFNEYFKKFKLFKPTSINRVDAILEGIFYPMEQLVQFSDNELYQLLVDRKIEEMSEEALIKYQVSKIIDGESECKTFEKTYDFYSSTGYQDINVYIREKTKGLPENFFYPLVGGNRKNIRLLYCIYQLDSFIKLSNKFGDGKTIYYRGITPPTLIVLQSCMENNKNVKDGKLDFELSLNDIGFSSITTDINIAKNFTKDYNCCILMFTIPKNIRYGDYSSKTHEKELILERNILYSEFEKKMKFDGIFIIECSIRKIPYRLLDIYNGNTNKIVEFYEKEGTNDSPKKLI
jgi:hypothetical protein